MEILIITQYFWPENFRINELALGLKDKGHQVTVMTGLPNYPDGRFFPGYGFLKNRHQDYNGIKVIRVPLLPRGESKGLRLALNYFSFAFFASVFSPFLCRGKFDLIFVYEPSPVTVGLPALVLKKLKSAPIMFWVQDLWPESLSATGEVRSIWILKMVEWLVRYIYRGCDRVLVQSKAFIAPIERMGVPARHILYFPNSAEQLYQPMNLEPDAPERSGIPLGFRVMFAGNIGTSQDFATILSAAQKLKGYPDIHWLIIGNGRMFSWVEAQVQERCLAETIHLLGRHPVEAMPRYFALADVMLVTLKRKPIFSLTIPSKVQSYLACGKPIIGVLDGEGARIIEEAGAGLTCPAENAGALADAVLSMYHMPQSERQAMGMCGRAYFNAHFEHKLLLDRLESWMEALRKRRKCM